MEYLNKVELRGVVGTLRMSYSSEHTITRMSVVTNHVYLNSSGNTVVESTWHEVAMWDIKPEALEKLNRGIKVHLKGRLKNDRYTNAKGKTVCSYIIVANSLEILSDE